MHTPYDTTFHDKVWPTTLAFFFASNDLRLPCYNTFSTHTHPPPKKKTRSHLEKMEQPWRCCLQLGRTGLLDCSYWILRALCHIKLSHGANTLARYASFVMAGEDVFLLEIGLSFRQGRLYSTALVIWHDCQGGRAGMASWLARWMDDCLAGWMATGWRIRTKMIA